LGRVRDFRATWTHDGRFLAVHSLQVDPYRWVQVAQEREPYPQTEDGRRETASQRLALRAKCDVCGFVLFRRARSVQRYSGVGAACLNQMVLGEVMFDFFAADIG
jgi:hypothetical protein